MTTARKYLDFEILKERWNRYDLNDTSIIKIRGMLQSIWHDGQNDKKRYGYKVAGHTEVLCGVSLQGTPDNTKWSKDDLHKNIEVEDCPYVTVAYETAEYKLDDGTKFVLHINIQKISRTKSFNRMGDRIYLINHDTSVRIERPKDL